MLVYRYLCKEELDNIIHLNISNIGRVYRKVGQEPVEISVNSFGGKYLEGQRYLHFFKHKEDMLRIQSLNLKDGKDYYFCTFDIPYRNLIFGKGKGYYDAGGYDIPFEDVREYIVNVNNFSPKWLIDVELDAHKHEIIENSKLSSQSTLAQSQNLEPEGSEPQF